MAYIELTRQGITQYVLGRTQGWRMVVTASNADGGLPNEIFVYQRVNLGITYSDQFVNVASPADIEEYPVGDPASSEVPFYRLPYVDLVFRNVQLSNDAWAGIKQDVGELIRTLEAFGNLEVQEIATFGSSSSSSA